MPDRHGRRRESLLRSSRTEGVDAWLISSETNVGYLTGFTGDATWLVLLKDRTIAVSDGRYTEQLARECPDVEAHIRPVGQPMTEGMGEVVRGLGVGRLAFEPAHLTYAAFEKLREELPTVELKGVAGKVENLRAVKDREEVAEIRRAIAVAERAFAMLKAGLRLDETEKQATDNLESYLRRCGATAASFPPIVAAGPNAALPHYQGDDATRIGSSEFTLVDWGASLRPYKSDLTRMILTGKVTPKFAKVYRSVLAAQEKAIAAICPGIPARDVDAVARASLEADGLGHAFTHGLGHGLGRDIHEAPMLRRESTQELKAGMVVTVEPGAYLPVWGGVRIEDDVLVTPDGREVLSREPKDLDAIRL